MVAKLWLKPGREKSVLAKHPWIFSGAVSHVDAHINGDVVQVVDIKGAPLGFGYCNKKSQIFCRMLSFHKHFSVEAGIKQRIVEAMQLRTMHCGGNSAYRVVNAEGDFLPGLIIDRYLDVFVIQISTLGMEKLRPLIVQILVELYQPRWIYEKSNAPSRKEEGLQPCNQTLYGTEELSIEIEENGLKFDVDIIHGQKTGFFLDQQAMRKRIGETTKGRHVLNCCCYTGGFSLYALSGGAASCDSIDISEDAINVTACHIEKNGLGAMQHREIVSDVFSYLRQEHIQYDYIILDPPAFAKKKSDVSQALRGYKEINRLAMQMLPVGGLLFTASCSYHVDDNLFRKMLFGAALDAKKDVRIVESHRSSWDHPQNIYCPEGQYLKGYLLYIS